jgi:hypothetical protein
VTRSRAYKKTTRPSSSRRTERLSDGLFAAARLHINFFQPSFKLKKKRREGAKVINRHHAPAIPCERALAHPALDEAVQVPPSRDLLCTRSRSAAGSDARRPTELGQQVDQRAGTVAAVIPKYQINAAIFTRSLGEDWKSGEQRAIHRRPLCGASRLPAGRQCSIPIFL